MRQECPWCQSHVFGSLRRNQKNGVWMVQTYEWSVHGQVTKVVSRFFVVMVVVQQIEVEVWELW